MFRFQGMFFSVKSARFRRTKPNLFGLLTILFTRLSNLNLEWKRTPRSFVGPRGPNRYVRFRIEKISSISPGLKLPGRLISVAVCQARRIYERELIKVRFAYFYVERKSYESNCPLPLKGGRVSVIRLSIINRYRRQNSITRVRGLTATDILPTYTRKFFFFFLHE